MPARGPVRGWGHGAAHPEVTDPALKERVVVAFGTENRGAASFLKQIGVAPERTPEGFAAAVPYVAVFEVTPAGA